MNPAAAHLRFLVVLAGVMEMATALAGLCLPGLLGRLARLPADSDLFTLQLMGSYQFILAAALALGGWRLATLEPAARLANLFHGCFLVFAIAALAGVFTARGPVVFYLWFCVAYHGLLWLLTWRALFRFRSPPPLN